MDSNSIVIPTSAKPTKIKVKARPVSSAESTVIINEQAHTVTKKNVTIENVTKAIHTVNSIGNTLAKTTEICTDCEEVLGRFQFNHAPWQCPLHNSSYCNYCSRYGHISKNCPTSPPPWATKVCYLEQLIPSGDIERFGITTRTLLSSEIHVPDIGTKIPDGRGTIEMRDSDKEIKAWLRAHGVPATESSKKNRVLLNKYADSRGLVIVWLA